MTTLLFRFCFGVDPIGCFTADSYHFDHVLTRPGLSREICVFHGNAIAVQHTSTFITCVFFSTWEARVRVCACVHCYVEALACSTCVVVHICRSRLTYFCRSLVPVQRQSKTKKYKPRLFVYLQLSGNKENRQTEATGLSRMPLGICTRL